MGNNGNISIDKQLALSNLFYFNKNVIDYSQMEIVPHFELCDFIQHWGTKHNKLILMPRGSFKSSCASVGYSLWLMVQPENSPWTIPSLIKKGGNRNIRILLDGEEKNKVPLEKLSEIKGKVGASKFIKLFGKLKPGISTSDFPWRDEKITITIRDTSVWGVPTISIGGVDISVTGAHFDLIIADDLHGETNTRTAEQIEKVVDHFKYYGPLLDPQGYLIVIGTYWNAKDVYHYIQNNPDILAEYDVFIRRAHNNDGSLLFPEILSEEKLRREKIVMGVQYYPQYELRIVSGEDALVKRDDIRYFKTEGEEIHTLSEDGWGSCIITKYTQGRDSKKILTISDLTITTTCDEAYTKERYSDYTGVVTKGEDEKGNWYILESKRGRWKESEIIDELNITIDKWHPLLLGLESTRFDLMASELEKRRIYPKELKHGGRSKHERFRALQPMFARNKIYVQQRQTNLLEEIFSYRRDKFTGAHDDESDALAYQRDMGITPHRERTPLATGGHKMLGEI